MSIGLIVLLILLILAAWFWSDSLAAREHVTRVCTRACAQLDIQFLDETVALRRLALARSEAGHVVIVRFYRFDFSAAGYDRWRGRAVIRGRQLDAIELHHPDGDISLLGGKEGVGDTPLPSRRDLEHRSDSLH